MEINKFLAALKDAFFPVGITCNACGAELSEGEREFSLCRSCEGKLVKTEPAKFGEITVYSRFHYESVARKYVLDYKDSDKPYIARYMAKYLYEAYADYGLDADAVCYVPSSPAALRRRGYDAMEIVAEEFSTLSGIETGSRLFRKDGIDQTKLKSEERAENVKGKFLSRGGFSGTVLLLDDVVTTGATLKECSDVILRHGADKVICLTFAKARE